MKNSLVFIIGMVLVSCAPMVKTDLKSLHEHPEQYKGKRVIITADIKDLIEEPEAYLDKKIEVTGYVASSGFRRAGDWSFILKNEAGQSIKCYEREYRVQSWIMPEVALRKAEENHDQVTVVGKFEKSLKNLRIELDWIEHNGQHFDTDYKPPAVWLPIF